MIKTLRWLAAAIALAVAALAPLTFAQTGATPATEAQIRAAFAAADVNKDGVVDIDEAVGDVILVFARLDTNRDGYLTTDELKNYDPVRFKRADRDGDGKLSMPEVAAERVYEFFLVDVNRDGVVTIEELLVYEAKTRGTRK